MKDKMTIILFSGEMDKAIAAFTLATTAAASGMEVSIYFTFWGLNILKKRSEYAISKSQLLLQKIFNMLTSHNLPISRLNMLGLGSRMMKKLMKKTKMTSLDELMKLAKELGVKYIACTTSCGIMGLSPENLIKDVNVFGGATTYLAEAKESKINLFI